MTKAKWWLFWLAVGTTFWLVVGIAIARAAWTESTISHSGFGMRSVPSLSTTATCRNSGHEAVWLAETGTSYLDIIQVGSMDGSLFYAYGRGTPNGVNSLYHEVHLGPSGTKWHSYALNLSRHIWTIVIDGHVVAHISDSFRNWRLRATQVMSEGNLPFGPAECYSYGHWFFGGYGPQPQFNFGTNWWKVQ